MRACIIIGAMAVLAGAFLVGIPDESSANALFVTGIQPGGAAAPRANSLCSRDEQVIFSCSVKRSGKIVSLCGSKDLDKDHGYLQYRFGLPGKVEMEFPKDRQGTQQQFQYSHYFRARFDETQINFNLNGYAYSVFDNYNGEEKHVISEQGVSVTPPGKPKEVSFVCSAKAKADYSKLADILPQATQ